MIAAKDFVRDIEFTTTTADYELLQDTNVKAFIMERLGITAGDDATYNTFISGNKLNMYFEIYFDSKQYVSINGGYYQPTIVDTLYYSGNFIYPLQSLKIQGNNVSGTLSLQIA